MTPNAGEDLSRHALAIVGCVESGVLEQLFVRMAGSLRKFGGRLSQIEIYAVTPRVGPPLAPATRRSMAELDVQHVRLRARHRYAWHHYLNKPLALAKIEAITRAETIVWLDSDVLCLREPIDLLLPPSIDFVASAPDKGVIGSSGRDDPNDSFWRRAAAFIGMDVDDLPWVDASTGLRLRFYWNSGVLAYRASSQLGREYLADCLRFLDERVARSHNQVHFMDQAVLGLTVLRLGLVWKPLLDSYNFPLLNHLADHYEAARLAPVRLLHFHDSMLPRHWPRLLAALRQPHPEVYEWLAPQGPLGDLTPAPWRLFREALRLQRGVRRRLYYTRSGFAKPSAGPR